MKWKGGKLRRGLAELLELPKEVVLDLPKLTLIGNFELYIENHKGLIEYTSERLRIGTSSGELVILGSRLGIAHIFRDSIGVEGVISGIEFRT